MEGPLRGKANIGFWKKTSMECGDGCGCDPSVSIVIAQDGRRRERESKQGRQKVKFDLIVVILRLEFSSVCVFDFGMEVRTSDRIGESAILWT